MVALQRSPRQEAPSAEAREALLGSLAALRRRAALWVLERDRVLAALRAAGLDPVVLKGGALCTLLYAEPVERDFADLDLLLPRHQVEEAIAVLLAARYRNPWNEAQVRGYRQHHYHLPLSHPHGFVVELHWGLTKPGAPFTLSGEEFLAHAVPATPPGPVPARVPRVEHLVLHVVGQNTQDRFPRIVRLVDLDRLVRAYPSLDWPWLERAAQRGGLQHALGVSLQLTRWLFATPVPPDVLWRVRPGRIVRLHLGLLQPRASFLERRFARSPAAGRLLTVWLMADARLRVGYVLRLLAGSDDPLAWLWRGAEGPTRSGARFITGVASVGKLVACQLGLYLRALAASLTCRGRAAMRFWPTGIEAGS
jgi:hypothetical protein